MTQCRFSKLNTPYTDLGNKSQTDIRGCEILQHRLQHRNTTHLQKVVCICDFCYRTKYSSFFFLQIWQLTSWDLFLFKKCILYTSQSPGSKIFDHITYFTFWLKIVELTDTVVFVLRKKRNQITYLHVFHHASTMTLMYLLVKYYRGMKEETWFVIFYIFTSIYFICRHGRFISHLPE